MDELRKYDTDKYFPLTTLTWCHQNFGFNLQILILAETFSNGVHVYYKASFVTLRNFTVSYSKKLRARAL